MRINKFTISLAVRVIILTVTVFALFHFLYSDGYLITTVIISLVIILQVYLLVVYLDKTNRELARFFNSIRLSDFSSSFAHNTSSAFKELNDSLVFVINQFNQTRSEKEENFQYLQTIVRHISTGLISFTEDGKIGLINNAAKKLLGKSDIINISALASYGNLVSTLKEIKSGERELVKIDNGSIKQVAVYAAGFKMKNEFYKLVSLQDISSELERERMSNELDIAHDIQMKLLPKKNIEIEGYTIDALCIPAKEIGGDYYDYTELGNGRYGIVIGDVAGKGMPAAIYMTLTKGIFQSFAGADLSPKDVLIKMNSLIYKIIERNYFVTMLYAVLDTQSHKLTFARAGHEALLHFSRSDEQVKCIRPAGIGIGLEKGNVFSSSIKEAELTMGRGDIVLIHTDGVTDTVNKENISFGSERIIKLITENKNSNSPELIKNFFVELGRFRNDYPQYDDITLISLKRNN